MENDKKYQKLAVEYSKVFEVGMKLNSLYFMREIVVKSPSIGTTEGSIGRTVAGDEFKGATET